MERALRKGARIHEKEETFLLYRCSRAFAAIFSIQVNHKGTAKEESKRLPVCRTSVHYF
jgi:hypothetical protein